MRITGTAVKLGAMSLVLLLFTALIVVVFGQMRFDRTTGYTALFKNASGLRARTSSPKAPLMSIAMASIAAQPLGPKRSKNGASAARSRPRATQSTRFVSGSTTTVA